MPPKPKFTREEIVQTALGIVSKKGEEALTAKELGMNIIDGDHFCTENPVIYALHERLNLAFPCVELRVSQRHDQTAQFA